MVNGETTHVLNKPIIVRGVCERTSKSQVCAESTFILHLICTGMNTRGSLPLLLKASLEDYHPADMLRYEEVIFDFGSHQKLDQWKSKIQKLETVLATCKFKRKIIFVTVHSELERGDLFAGTDEHGDSVSMEVEEVCAIKSIRFYTFLIFLFKFMDYLFFGHLRKVVATSTLFILACGPLVGFQDSFLALKRCIKR